MGSRLGSMVESFIADSDLSAKQFFVVKVSGVNKVDLNDSATGKVLGILQNKPSADGQAAEVCIFGPTKGKIGTGGCSAGAYLGFDTSGQLVAKTSDKDLVAAYALETAVAGDIAEIFWFGPTFLGV